VILSTGSNAVYLITQVERSVSRGQNSGGGAGIPDRQERTHAHTICHSSGKFSPLSSNQTE